MNSENRPGFSKIYMDFALSISQRSTCARGKVGCVIVSTDFRYVYAIGYNGNYTRGPNGCDSTEVGACGCLHAEDNAIINCTVSRYEPKYVFCTLMPCATCAKRIINLGGVQRVSYHAPYRLDAGKKLLESASIRCEQYPRQLPAEQNEP